VALCLAVALFISPIALAQDSRTIRHAWAPSATVDIPFSWTLLWKGMDPSGQATVQSPLPTGTIKYVRNQFTRLNSIDFGIFWYRNHFRR
jgi:hypothetical protein